LDIVQNIHNYCFWSNEARWLPEFIIVCNDENYPGYLTKLWYKPLFYQNFTQQAIK